MAFLDVLIILPVEVFPTRTRVTVMLEDGKGGIKNNKKALVQTYRRC